MKNLLNFLQCNSIQAHFQNNLSCILNHRLCLRHRRTQFKLESHLHILESKVWKKFSFRRNKPIKGERRCILRSILRYRQCHHHIFLSKHSVRLHILDHMCLNLNLYLLSNSNQRSFLNNLQDNLFHLFYFRHRKLLFLFYIHLHIWASKWKEKLEYHLNRSI